MAKRETPPPAVDGLKFEDAMAQLERLVEQIESGEVGLEEALHHYEHGISLIQRCRTVLSTAEQRIAELTAGSNGELRLVGEGDSQGSEPLIADEDEGGQDDA